MYMCASVCVCSFAYPHVCARARVHACVHVLCVVYDRSALFAYFYLSFLMLCVCVCGRGTQKSTRLRRSRDDGDDICSSFTFALALTLVYKGNHVNVGDNTSGSISVDRSSSAQAQATLTNKFSNPADRGDAACSSCMAGKIWPPTKRHIMRLQAHRYSDYHKILVERNELCQAPKRMRQRRSRLCDVQWCDAWLAAGVVLRCGGG